MELNKNHEVHHMLDEDAAPPEPAAAKSASRAFSGATAALAPDLQPQQRVASATPSRVRCDTPSRARASTLCAVCKAVIDEIDKSLTEEQRKSGEEAIEKHMFKYCDTAKGKDKTMVRASPADGPLPPAVLRSRRCL